MSPSEKGMQKKARKTKNQPMLLCHFSNGELQGLDKLQGGPSIDPATGIREYSRLSALIQVPAIRELFKEITGAIKRTGKIPAPIRKLEKLEKEYMMPYRETPVEHGNKEIRKIEKMGRSGDSKLAFIPYDLAEFLIDLIGDASVNPKTGLLEFGFFNEIIRGVGTVAGAIFGGPLGAGVGRALAGAATGQKIGSALMGGVKMGGLAYLGGAAMNGLGIGAGAAAGSKMAALNGMLGAHGAAAPGLAGIGSAFGYGNAIAPGVAGAAGAGITTPTIAASAVGKIGTGAMTAVPAAAAAAPAAGNAGFFSNLMANPMLMQAGIAGLGMLGEQKQHKHEKQMYEAQKKAHDEEVARGEAYKASMGIARPWTSIEANPKTVNKDFFGQSDKSLSRHGIYTASPFLRDDTRETPTAHYKGGNVRSYNKGTLVKGPGKGQQDLIKTEVPEGSYIIDASSTSMFGDGSSDAGGNILKQFENKLKRSIPKNKYVEIEQRVVRRSPQLPVYLSNDEYKFDPVTVSILGKGSNSKGSSILKQMVNNLREHKNSNGNRLPPKSKNPEFYMKGR